MTDETYRRHPLAWPSGWKRTPSHRRQRAAFSKTVQKPATRLNTARDLARAELDA